MEFLEKIIIEFWDTIAEMSPYLLFGFFVAGAISVLISQKTVERHLGGRGFWPLFKATIFGIPLPLCSCGVIPVSISLHKHGASKGSTIAFLLSTPQTGVDSIFVTLSLLGPIFAVYRPLSAFVTGLVGGTAVDLFDRSTQNENLPPEKCTGECCSSEHKHGKFIRGLKYGFGTLPRDIGKAMLIGLIVAAFISAIVPEGFFAEYLGTGIFAMVIMMLLGIPVYVCATASVPVAAALILKGLTPGAALVFLMTGPATNAASFVTIWKSLGRATALIYLASVAGCALLAGIVLDLIVPRSSFVDLTSMQGQMLPDIVKYISAIALLIVIGYGIVSKMKQKSAKKEVEQVEGA